METLPSSRTQSSQSRPEDGTMLMSLVSSSRTGYVQELFHEDAQGSQSHTQPWWKVKLFVWEPVLFGTWDGVFTTCMINIFGVVLFLRTGWLVGNTGVLLGMLLVSLVVLVALVTVMSGIGVCERCCVGGGGVYSMISTVLGGRVGGTVGLLYVFGQCVAGAMYITGFAESIAEVLNLTGVWVVRAISVAVLLGLLGINLAGVKWIVRLQLLLLGLLAISTLDFVVGTFSHLDPAHGFVGYSEELLQQNSLPDYTPGETFFTVFGVFFPAATGVMAGFNMSSDLQRPEHNIPVGTLAAVCTSWFLYLVFVFLLGAICTREALRYDFLIAEKVSLVGFLFLLGLYISSLASCMGGLYGAPRILQCIAQEKVIPALGFLGHGRGPNKTPVAAICLTSLVTMAFIFIGQVNVLAPIVTINFMLTYSIIDYSYFCVAMTYDIQVKERKALTRETSARGTSRSLLATNHSGYGTGGIVKNQSNGTLLEFTRDMDQILQLPNPVKEESGSSTTLSHRSRKMRPPPKQTLMDSFGIGFDGHAATHRESVDRSAAQTPSPDIGEGHQSQEGDEPQRGSQEAEAKGLKMGTEGEERSSPSPFCTEGNHQVSPSPSFTEANHPPLFDSADSVPKPKPQESEIQPMPKSFYSRLCNHWIALIGALCSITIMFVIEWIYACINIAVAIILFLYIGQANPGLPIGAAARFSFFRWVRSCLKKLGRREVAVQDQIVVTPSFLAIGMATQQLTEENADFASRDRYHHSSVISADALANRLKQ
ncbi:solute carrier family 12 member 8 isoform X2 [Megalops cyprinoides]|uniref:solute carrier family 12 member 8 isoform X2 n=1 Tax=Megalops cyprinoides TaxID=118141 RepID=UPI001864DA8E|nr:solute carrier family 12 member 8 isoform X2 [Megalops cyprinoides]